MKHVIKTGLNVNDSKYALDEAFKVYSKQHSQYKPLFGWKKNDLATFSFTSPVGKLDGLILVVEDQLILDMNVPFLARPFQNKAISLIETEVQIWIERIKKSSDMNSK